MTFHSILFRDRADAGVEERAAAPPFFADLNLDQVVASVTAGREEYDLAPFFYSPLDDVDDIAFRHEVMHDLEDSRLIHIFRTFAEAMRTVRENLTKARILPYAGERERWFVDAADVYCTGVEEFVVGTMPAPPASRGLMGFCQYVMGYAKSERFGTLCKQVSQIKAELASIRFGLLLQGRRVELCALAGETEYSPEIAELFERFKDPGTKPYSFRFSRSDAMTQVDSMIFNLLSRRYPDVFSRLSAFCADQQAFQDQTLLQFEREIQFYIAYLEHIQRLRNSGLSFCYPTAHRENKEEFCSGGFDLALADKLVSEERVVVCNDFHLSGSERFIVVTGPNQGGKTTFARAFGQIHYLANLGCPVPGRKARLLVCDRIFTHFERQEDIADLRGRLKDDLVRIEAILNGATERSVVIINEIFSSTALRDATVLSRKISRRLIEKGLLCVWVTFVDEMASLSQEAVSMVSVMAPESPTERTYQIVRRPADGLAYAHSIARKHRLTSEMIEERLKP